MLDPNPARINLRQLALRDAADVASPIVKNRQELVVLINAVVSIVWLPVAALETSSCTWGKYTKRIALRPASNSSSAAATTRSGEAEFSLEFF